ncbi:MAG TPA: toprim domain-containing protein [Thermoplasmata archaeon]|nr:toprim domain-containing protein [Thermoplasmata archaeon]
MTSEHGTATAFEEFVELWGRLRSESERPGTVVVVEGERDRRSVRRLGWSGEVALVHRGARLAGIAQALADRARRVIVLTDWDSEGGQLARRLREFLESDAAELDLDYRRRLARVLRGEVVHVEGLYGWARRTAEKLGRSIDDVTDGAELARSPTE